MPPKELRIVAERIVNGVVYGADGPDTGEAAAGHDERQHPLADGGWGGSHSVASSIEETGVALTALSRARPDADPDRIMRAVARGARWLVDATKQGECTVAFPTGLYFARLWYFEEVLRRALSVDLCHRRSFWGARLLVRYSDNVIVRCVGHRSVAGAPRTSPSSVTTVADATTRRASSAEANRWEAISRASMAIGMVRPPNGSGVRRKVVPSRRMV
jgi:hypothetical protein